MNRGLFNYIADTTAHNCIETELQDIERIVNPRSQFRAPFFITLSLLLIIGYLAYLACKDNMIYHKDNASLTWQRDSMIQRCKGWEKWQYERLEREFKKNHRK